MKYESGKELFQKGKEWNKDSGKKVLQYAVGGLMYVPADHESIKNYILEKRFPAMKSLVLCLEDSIMDENLAAAEQKLYETLQELDDALSSGQILLNDLPLIFVRVRNSEQLREVYDKIKPFRGVLSGFNLPKFGVENKAAYEDTIAYINKAPSVAPLYFMPIIESLGVIHQETRQQALYSIKDTVDDMKDYILNMRVGGNDFCKHFGVRRHVDETIYEIGVVNNLLTDILTVFSMDYVVSGPVWEYFAHGNGAAWEKGLRREIRRDLLNGFIGKTMIHPTQLPVLQEELVVRYEDYMDALSVLHWTDQGHAVAKGHTSGRMNELKVHKKWAEKIVALADVYGVKKNESIGE